MSEYQRRLNEQWDRNRIEQEQRDLRQAKIDEQRFYDRLEAFEQANASPKSWQAERWQSTSPTPNPSGRVSKPAKAKAPPRSREEVVDDLSGALLFLTTVVLGGWAGYTVFAAGAGLLTALAIFAGIGLVLHWNPVRKLAEMIVHVFLWIVRLLLWAALAGGALYVASLFL